MEFSELIEARRSVRKYAPSEITKAEMETIVVEALNAPSWKNTEVTRYYAAITPTMKLGSASSHIRFFGSSRVTSGLPTSWPFTVKEERCKVRF